MNRDQLQAKWNRYCKAHHIRKSDLRDSLVSVLAASEAMGSASMPAPAWLSFVLAQKQWRGYQPDTTRVAIYRFLDRLAHAGFVAKRVIQFCDDKGKNHRRNVYEPTFRHAPEPPAFIERKPRKRRKDRGMKRGPYTKRAPLVGNQSWKCRECGAKAETLTNIDQRNGDFYLVCEDCR